MPPPSNARNLPFATLLRLAMDVGLGRASAEVENRWTVTTLSSAIAEKCSGFSAEAVKKWRTGHAIPNEQNASILIKRVTIGEQHAQPWFDCLKEASSRDRTLNPTERINRAKYYRFIWSDDAGCWRLAGIDSKTKDITLLNTENHLDNKHEAKLLIIEPIKRYIDNRRKRCREIRNFIYDVITADLNEIYIETFLNQITDISEDKFINNLMNPPRDKRVKVRPTQVAVIRGGAGSGKSFFTRRLFIKFSDQVRDRVPIFIECRELNSQYWKAKRQLSGL